MFLGSGFEEECWKGVLKLVLKGGVEKLCWKVVLGDFFGKGSRELGFGICVGS